MSNKLTVSLQGGLGNVLFQIAGGSSIAKKNNYQFCLTDLPKTHHSEEDYYSSILQKWKCYYSSIDNPIDIHEQSYAYSDWTFPPNNALRLCGYFQNYKYIDSDFVDSLVLPEVDTLHGAFLHIRGGDYVNHWFHDVKLNYYYSRAIQQFPSNTKFYVMTNDIPYAQTLSFLKTINHEFVDEKNEVRTLALMKNCTLGGICPNSTFSWWGGYLNRSRTIVLPSKWFNDPRMYVEGYFFPGSVVIPV